MSPRYFNRFRSGPRAPRPRQLTAAQSEANGKRFAEAAYTIEGRYARNQLVSNYAGEVYRVTTYGIRYHEDVESRLYGAAPAKAPKEWKATVFLREAIETVLKQGTHEPNSGSGNPKKKKPMPTTLPIELSWRYTMPEAPLAAGDYLSVQGDYVRAVRPIYDDAPDVAWMHDAKLSKKIREAIAIAPEPYRLANANVLPKPKKKKT